MDKNFTGQNLNGRSFRGEDLRGADFSACQLKSCDFTDADLTDAKFYGAMVGINGQRKFAKWLVAAAFSMTSRIVALLFNYFFAYAANDIYKTFIEIDVSAEENHNLLWIGSLYAASICLALLATLKYRD